jgi:Protein of unknown function (DUF2971)
MTPTPKLLYHYASIDAFKGIVDNQYLRMTKYDQLNDTSEVTLARKLLISTIQEYDCDPEFSAFKEFLLEALEHFKDLNVYITSYSEKGNDLGQWRAYTPRGGVALGFDSNELSRGFIDEHFPSECYEKDRGLVTTASGGFIGVRQPARFHKCIYVSDEAKGQVERSVASWFEPNTYAGMHKESRRLDDDSASNLLAYLCQATLSKTIYNLICTIKHEAFKSESEWRWVNINPKPESFTKRLDEKNREYVTGGIHPEDCIKEVWISPHGDKETIRRVLNFYKERDGLAFDIKESDIPYRG